MEQYGDKFTDKFEANKQQVHHFVESPSKKLKNIIAGYATRLVKQRAKGPRMRRTPMGSEKSDEWQ